MLEGVLQQTEGLPSVICYHYPCSDGAFAALAGYLYYKQQGRPVRFSPLTVYKEHTVDELKLKGDEVVYFLDYAGPAGFAQQVAKACRRVIVLDHHKTAAEQLADRKSLPSNMDVFLDMDRSGATIALDYFRPQALSEQLLAAFRYVEDADLWRWKLPGSKAFHAGLADLRLDYDASSSCLVLEGLTALDPQAVIERGEVVLQRQEQLIAEAVAGAEVLQLGGAAGKAKGWGSCLGCVVSGDLIGWRSSLGNKLAVVSQERGLAAGGVVAYQETGMENGGADMLKVSIRGVGDFDTTAVTQALGGGGHKSASSCIISAQDFKGWREQG